jgi:LPS O-antigen subunit length determinant protein (WzzB/FepE family)
MNNQPKTHSNDEILLKEYLRSLWDKKIYIFFFIFLSVVCGSMYLHNVERQYLVEYKLKPVGENQQKNLLPNLGGLASIAGIQLPSNSTDNFVIFKELLYSNEVAKKIFKNKVLIQQIFSSEWDTSLNNFSAPPKSKAMTYISDFKRLLSGNNEVIYSHPNAKRLSDYISKNINITEDKKTGFLIIKAESSKPNMFLSLIVEISEASDKIMRQRYIDFSIEPLAFYKEKLRFARSREHREALAGLISKEEQKLMLASVGKYFTAEPYLDPKISLHPTSPKPKQVLFLSLIFGLFIGCVIILLQNTTARDN